MKYHKYKKLNFELPLVVSPPSPCLDLPCLHHAFKISQGFR